MVKRLAAGVLSTLGYRAVRKETYDDLHARLSASERALRRLEILKQEYDAGRVGPFQMHTVTVARLFDFERLLEMVKDVPGDIVECGVGRAYSLISMIQVCKLRNYARHVWGFDSFEGLPEPHEMDKSDRAVKKGDVSYDIASVLQRVRQLVGDEHYLHANLTLVKGFFEETLPTAPVGQIALLHLDVDLYESYKTCLEHFYPKVAPGGIVVFDEYIREAYRFPGGVKAIDEFFADQKDFAMQRGTFGKYYVVKKAT